MRRRSGHFRRITARMVDAWRSVWSISSLFAVCATLCALGARGYEIPEVEWLHPNSGHIGGGEVLMLSGKKLADVRNLPGAELTCKFDNVFVPAYYVDSETVKCTAPAHREGFVSVEFALNNETGDFLRTKGYQFVGGAKVDAVNSIYGLSGGIVDVVGADMHVSQYCRFGEETTVGHIVSSSLMKCESPSIDSGTVPIDVSLTTSSFFEAFSSIHHTYVGFPSVNQIQPKMGTSEGGTLVTVTGQNFASTSMLRCRFAAIDVMGVWQTASTVECTTPGTTSGAKEFSISMNHRDYVSYTDSYTFESSLAVDAIAPSQVSSSGSSHVVLTVPGVVQLPDLSCKFGSHSVPAVAGIDNDVSCVAPAGVGFVTVAVAANGQDFHYSSDGLVSIQLEQKDVIEITRITPRFGAVGGGTLVHLDGKNLLQEGPVCRFGTVAVAAMRVSSSLIICETPSMLEGAYALDVSVVATAVELAMKPQFLFDPPPVVTALSPFMGLVEGGTTVTAAGHSFSDSHELGCKFGSIGPVVGEWIAVDEYRCIAPAHSKEIVNFDVGMLSEFGADFADGPQLTFMYVDEATVTTVIDNDNNTATITGTGFVPGQDVYCNLGNGDALVPGTVLSDGSVLCGLPEDNNGVNEYDITIVDSKGNNIVETTDANGILTRKVSLDHLSPFAGPAIGGTMITVYGDHFSTSSLCRFGTLTPTPATFISSTQVLCESSTMEVGYHHLAISNNPFDWSVPGLPFEFMNTSSSVLSRVSPTSGPFTGGTILTLSGLSLRNDVLMGFWFGTIMNVHGRWISSSTATCVSPASRVGVVRVNVFHHNSASEIKLMEGGVDFEYKEILSLSLSVIPASGFVTGGGLVKLHGENFYGSHRSCKFGTTTTNGLSVSDGTQCNVPASKAGFTVVTVSMNSQDFTYSHAEFQYVVKPRILRITPFIIPTLGSSITYISGFNMAWGGTNMSGQCVFKVNGKSQVSNLHTVSSTLVICISPQGEDEALVQLSYDGIGETTSVQIQRDKLPEIETGLPKMRGVETGGGVLDIYGDFSTELSVITCKVGTISGIALTQGSSEKVECILPAHSPGQVPLSVAMNGRDSATEVLYYDYIANVETTEPHRTLISLDGGSFVDFTLSQPLPSSISTLPVACVFDLQPVVATVTSDGVVSCLAPDHASGFVSIGIQVNDVGITMAPQAQLSYEVQGEIAGLQPRDGGESGGEVVKISGKHFNSFTHAKFVFGQEQPAVATVISSALALVEQPAHLEGSVVVSTLASGSTSLTDDETQPSGVVFDYSVEDATSGIIPQDASDEGGSVALIYFKTRRQQSFDNAACKFGTLAPISGVFTVNALECVIPAHAQGLVPVYARLFGESFDKLTHPFNYRESVEVSSSAIYPSFGSMHGGVPVNLVHENPMGSSIKCHIAGFHVSAVTVSTTPTYISECITPAYTAGFTQISLGATPGIDEADLVFMFQPDPTLTSSHPNTISEAGGEVVILHGSDFLDFDRISVKCVFGTFRMPAQVHSTALTMCETPHFKFEDNDSKRQVELYVDTSESLDYSEHVVMTVLSSPTFVYNFDAKVGTSGGDVIKMAAAPTTSATIVDEMVDLAIGHVGTIGPMYARSTGDSIEFITPATAPRNVTAWLSSNLGSKFGDLSVHYFDDDIVIVSSIPGRASTAGLTELTVEIEANKWSSSPTACKFGLFPVPLSQMTTTSSCTSINEKSCTNFTLVCAAPTHLVGFVEVSVVGFDGPGVDFELFKPPAMKGAFPLIGFDGGSVIHVTGFDLHVPSLCHFGPQTSKAHLVSSALSICTSPSVFRDHHGRSPILTSFEFGFENDDQVTSEHHASFTYMDYFRMLSPSFSHIVSEGGQLLMVSFEGPSDEHIPNHDTFCRFGTILTSGERLHNSVTCATPAGVGNTRISVSLTFNSKEHIAAGLVQYYDPLSILSVIPSRAGASGGTPMNFATAALLLPDTLRLGCQLDDTMVPARYAQVDATHSQVMCETPMSTHGFSVVEIVSLPDQHARVELEIFVEPVVFNIQPQVGTVKGSTILFVSGTQLHESAYCFFGNDAMEPMEIQVVSSHLAICVTPPSTWQFRFADVTGLSKVIDNDDRMERLVDFGVSSRNDASAISVNGSVYEYIQDPVFTALSPSTGSQNGGTTLSLSAASLHDSIQYSCGVGTFFPIAAYRTQSDVLTCVTPARKLGGANITISGNKRDLSSNQTVTFDYQIPPRISGIIPKVGLSGSRSPIFITGSNFVNSSSLTCRFGRELTKATYLSPTSILCIVGLEQSGTRTVFVEVSTNGIDFSNERLLFHFSQCPSGSYCPESEAILCPRGAYCGGGKNFTLCPAGTFQPRTGQSDCLPTPVGFITPETGSMTPLVCPRGSVCDSAGLALPQKHCPPGHYCLEGTRTSDFTDFTIAERPLPCPFGMYCTAGVVSSASIAYNFTTPQQCYAGYVCEPGSITPQGTGPCPPGHYCPPGESLRCPKRMYCPGVANAEPKPCLPGEYNSEYGQQSCQKCPKGTICPGFAREKPEPCTPGFVCDEEGLAVAGTRCPAGHYCLENTISRDPLAIIDVAAILSASAKAGIELKEENFRPKPCPPTTFCTEGVATNLTLEGSFRQPQPCKEGSFCEWATGDSTVASSSATEVFNPMRPCTPGHYCPKRTYIPIPAPRGSFSSGSGNSAAVTCLPGTYTPYEGFQECLACPAGFECVDEATYKPQACPAGYFRSARDPVACRQCPKGTWGPAITTTEESLCLPCNSGIVCGIDGMSNNKPRGTGTIATNEYSAYCDSTNTPCSATQTTQCYDADKCVLLQLDSEGEAELCPEGYVCDARTSLAQHKCPDGYVCGYGTTPETQFVNKCPAGYYCPAGSSYSTRKQFPCQPCFFCPAGTGQVLNRCPNGTSSTASALSLDDCSADLITFWRVMPVSFDLIEKSYAKAVNGSSLNEDSLAAVRQSIDAGRKLLQVDDSSNSSTVSPIDPNATDPFAYMAQNSCENKNWELLNPTFILDSDGQNVAVDDENIPLMKFTLPRGHTARIKLDWRLIDENLKYGEHYELLIFTNPVIDDTRCAESDYKSVPCPPWDTADGITWLDMKVIAGEEQEKKCPPSQESLELPFWFTRNRDGTAAGFNVQEPAFGNYIWKRGLHELVIQALDDLPFRLELRMLHGRFQQAVNANTGLRNRASFLNSLCVDVDYPKRASSNELYSVHAILSFEADQDYLSPLNSPLASTFYRAIGNDYAECATSDQLSGCRRVDARVTIDYNSTVGAEWKKYKFLRQQGILTEESSASLAAITLNTSTTAEDWVITSEDGQQDENAIVSLPDIYESEKNILNEALWSTDQTLFAMDYLPFFSACRGHDSHIYLQHITETNYQPVTFGTDQTFVSYGESTLVPPEETVHIDQYSPQVQVAVADELSLSLSCFYEELFTEAAAKKRWYESEGDTLFYLTREPESQDALFEASILANDQTEPPVDKAKYSSAIDAQKLIPVPFGPVEGFVLTAGLIPTTVDFEILYYQESTKDKRIIAATVTMDNYVSSASHDGSYTLNVVTKALGWFDLLNFFAFDVQFYLVLFCVIGLVAVVLIFAIWLVVRIFTLLKDPPRFRFLPYIRIMIGPPLLGVALGMIPFVLCQFGFRAAFATFPIIKTFPISIDNIGREIDQAVVEKATAGRYAVCFLTAGMYMMGVCAEILVPAELKDEEEKELEDERYVDEVMFKPEVWKRSHFVLINLLVNVTNVFLIEFSFTDTFGVQFFTIFFLLKVVHVILEMQIETALGEAFLLAPVSVVLAASVGVATIGADDFTDFTLGFFFETIMGMVEYVYLDAFIAYCALVLPDKISYVVNFVLDLLPFKFGDDDDDIEEEVKVDAEDTLVEDLMGFLAAYGVNTANVYMTPIFTYFFLDYNDQLRLSHLYGFRQEDLQIYLLFSVFILPFQIIMDVLTFNIQELFHGWKVYEYLKYARYRFVNRTSRWKGLERVYDESIDPGLRAIDQMCFSSQYYFVVTLGGAGSFLFVLALSMMLRANYNMFEDILFWVCVILVLGASYTVKRLSMVLADRCGLWKITSSITEGEMIIEEELDEGDFTTLFAPKMQQVDESTDGRAMDITTADLTSDQFRHAFMSKNRDWVIDQLQDILSPRTARRLKLGKAVRRRMRAGEMSESDSEFEDEFGEVRLSESSDKIMRIWLTHAGSRASGRGANLLMLSDTSESEAETGMQRFPTVTLSEGASAALMGWLAAVKQLRANRQSSLKEVGVFSSTDFSSESDTDTEAKYATPAQMSSSSRTMMQTWLLQARESRKKSQQEVTNLSDDSGESSSHESSDNSSLKRAAVSPAAASMMRGWLESARAEAASNMDTRPQEKVVVRREKQALSSDSDSSNLESSSDPELPFDAERSKRAALSETSTSILSGWLSTAKGVFRSRRSTEIQQTAATLPEISEDDSDAGSALAPE